MAEAKEQQSRYRDAAGVSVSEYEEIGMNKLTTNAGLVPGQELRYAELSSTRAVVIATIGSDYLIVQQVGSLSPWIEHVSRFLEPDKPKAIPGRLYKIGSDVFVGTEDGRLIESVHTIINNKPNLNWRGGARPFEGSGAVELTNTKE